MELKWRFLFWTSAWLELFASVIRILTFFYWNPCFETKYKLKLAGWDDKAIEGITAHED